MTSHGSFLRKLHTWHQTALGLAVFGVLELALALGVGLLAIDSGALWYYLLGALLAFGGVRNFALLVYKLFRSWA